MEVLLFSLNIPESWIFYICNKLNFLSHSWTFPEVSFWNDIKTSVNYTFLTVEIGNYNNNTLWKFWRSLFPYGAGLQDPISAVLCALASFVALAQRSCRGMAVSNNEMLLYLGVARSA